MELAYRCCWGEAFFCYMVQDWDPLVPADFSNSWHCQGQFRAHPELCRVPGYVQLQNDCSAYPNYSFSILSFPQGGCGQKQVLSQILRALWGLEALVIQQWQLLMLGRWNLPFWKGRSVSKGLMSFSGMKSLSDLNISVTGAETVQTKIALLDLTRLAQLRELRGWAFTGVREWFQWKLQLLKQSLPFCGGQN